MVGAATLGCGFQLRARPLDRDRPSAADLHYHIDINRADVATLGLLPGVGPTIAQRIVEHRRDAGPFESLDAMHAVGGVGPKTVARIRPYIRP
jgi:competence ComEA-like helix-hairpin-helix protein